MADSNIVVAIFDDESKTYQAFSEVKRAAAEGKLKINGLTIMHRRLDGQFEVRDAAMKNYGGSIVGGIIGSLVGILGGPLGILLGWGAGSLVGGFRDAREILEDRNLFQRITQDMEVGRTVLVGELEDEQPYVVDQIVRRLNGELLRRRTEDVEADIKAAEVAQESARSAAQRVIDEDMQRRNPRESDTDTSSS
ncbi:MAG TPA: hypothetical protein VKZ61_07885 [Thermomicrobiales bacterium]|jgi:uncharacterized membrane protein|nr:hypothetical protein [Thermomicrobiales bacterium]